MLPELARAELRPGSTRRTGRWESASTSRPGNSVPAACRQATARRPWSTDCRRSSDAEVSVDTVTSPLSGNASASLSRTAGCSLRTGPSRAQAASSPRPRISPAFGLPGQDLAVVVDEFRGAGEREGVDRLDHGARRVGVSIMPGTCTEACFSTRTEPGCMEYDGDAVFLEHGRERHRGLVECGLADAVPESVRSTSGVPRVPIEELTETTFFCLPGAHVVDEGFGHDDRGRAR